MNKNPFSFYDFLGYLFPGIIVLTLTVFAVTLAKKDASVEEYFLINEFTCVFQSKPGLEWWKSTMLVVILAYVAGHLTAYLSSVTVEYFANSLFEYPSRYLLHKESIGFKALCRKYFVSPLLARDINLGRFLWRVFVFVLMLPISIPLLLFGQFLRLNDFVVRPLDNYVRNSIQCKLIQLSRVLKLDTPDVNSEADYHRIVMHYVYLNIPNCQRKADNYVAIYGFLRAMTLIACLYFDYLLILQLGTLDIHADVNWDAMLILLLMGLLCNVLFMGFVKFYRRFTLENYMALLTEK